MKLHLFPGLALLAYLQAAHAQSTTVGYRVDMIPAPYAGVDVHQLGLNNHGEVVGYTFGAGGYRAFIYSGGQSHEIPGLGGLYGTYAVDVNDSGLVCGYSSRPGDPNEVLFTFSNGVTTDIGQAPPGYQTLAYAINNSGQITGYDTDLAVHGDRAFRWTNGNFENLGTIAPAQDSLGFDINDMGDVCGGVGSNGLLRPALHTGSAFRYIGTSSGRALGINDSPVVVGQLEAARHAFYYEDATGTLLNISPLPSMGSELLFEDVNDAGMAISTRRVSILAPRGWST